MIALPRPRSSEPSFSDLVPYAALVDDGVILLKDGSLMAGWYFAGPDSESSTDAEQNDIARRINAILARLGSGWMIQVEAVRLATTAYPARERSLFPDPVSHAIDEERRLHFERESGHFESRHALVLTWKPLAPRKAGLARLVHSDAESRELAFVDTALDFFSNAIREVEQYLSTILSIRRMRTHQARESGGARIARYDELFQFIRFCLTGENHPVRLPTVPLYLDWLAVAEFHHGLGPQVDGRKLAVVAIDGLPAESTPGILEALDRMPLAYRWSTRFIPLDAHEARERLERTRKKWQQKVRPFLDQLFQTASRSVDRDAADMVAETEDAIAEASSGFVTFGAYTAIIVLFGGDEARLRDEAEAVRRLIQTEGFGARIETLNATEAFLGSLPGNSTANVREPLISSRNLADLIPLAAVWAGAETAPCPFYPEGAPWRPTRVYSDRVKTYIQFPEAMASTEAPVLFVVSGGENRIVNYRIKGDLMIVDHFVDRAILVSGVGWSQQKITIARGG